jgi:hypothetical protein
LLQLLHCYCVAAAAAAAVFEGYREVACAADCCALLVLSLPVAFSMYEVNHYDQQLQSQVQQRFCTKADIKGANGVLECTLDMSKGMCYTNGYRTLANASPESHEEIQ